MSVRLRAEEALREHQDRIGVLRGGANLYPGTAAKIVSQEWESLLRHLLRVAEKPQDHWDWKDVQIIEMVKDELTDRI